jgi:hypothetical protein
VREGLMVVRANGILAPSYRQSRFERQAKLQAIGKSVCAAKAAKRPNSIASLHIDPCKLLGACAALCPCRIKWEKGDL